jgi:hypothetical protein
VNTAIYLITFSFILTTVWLIILTIFSWRRAKEYKETLVFLNRQITRAADQIESDNVIDIYAGLEVISAFNSPKNRIAILPRLNELTRHENDKVAMKAKTLEDEILNSISKQAFIAIKKQKSLFKRVSTLV